MRKSESLLLTSLETVDIVVWGRNVLSYMVLLRRSTMNLKKRFFGPLTIVNQIQKSYACVFSKLNKFYIMQNGSSSLTNAFYREGK